MHGGQGWVAPLRSKHGSKTTLDVVWTSGSLENRSWLTNHHLLERAGHVQYFGNTRLLCTAVAADQPTPVLQQTQHKSEPPLHGLLGAITACGETGDTLVYRSATIPTTSYRTRPTLGTMLSRQFVLPSLSWRR